MTELTINLDIFLFFFFTCTTILLLLNPNLLNIINEHWTAPLPHRGGEVGRRGNGHDGGDDDDCDAGSCGDGVDDADDSLPHHGEDKKLEVGEPPSPSTSPSSSSWRRWEVGGRRATIAINITITIIVENMRGWRSWEWRLRPKIAGLVISPDSWQCFHTSDDENNLMYNLIISKIIQVVPKKWLIECCWSHSAQAQSPVSETPWVWKKLVLVVSY